jgi:ATP-dependent DNA ligase
MPRVVKAFGRAGRQAGPSRRGVPLRASAAFPASREAPSGAMADEIKLDGYRMAARIDNGRAQLLTRTGLDWTAKYPSAIAALANLNVKTAYIDGELCGVDEAGLQLSR